MNEADLAFAGLHVDLFDTYGIDAFVERAGLGVPVPVRVIKNEGVARTGEYGQVIATVTTLEFQVAQWLPNQGDIVALVDNPAWVKEVAVMDANDGHVAVAVMHG